MTAVSKGSRVLIIEKNDARAAQYHANVITCEPASIQRVNSRIIGKERLQADSKISEVCLNGQIMDRTQALAELERSAV